MSWEMNDRVPERNSTVISGQLEERTHNSPNTLSVCFSRVLMVLFFVYLLWSILSKIVDVPYLSQITTIIFLMFSISHSTALYGWKNTLFFYLESFIISFIYEDIAIVGNFCPYHYTNNLGLKIHEVPIVIPICWFAVMYFAFCVTNIIVYQDMYPIHSMVVLKIFGDGKYISYIILSIQFTFISFINAMIMTSWDLLMDYFMAIKESNWIWDNVKNDEYVTGFYGIPLCNFYYLWIPISFIISITYRLWLHFKICSYNAIDINFDAKQIFLSYFLPLFCFINACWIGTAYRIREIKSLEMVGFFTIGFTSIIALYTSIFIIPFKSNKND
eukprot:132632_1